MGTYLSTPVTEKCEESGESFECPDVPCAWGVVDMQGWRKGMEDAHVAVTDISLPDGGGKVHSDAKVFGVFDGHGGAEVARFCSLYLVSVLTQQSPWKEGKLSEMKGEDVKHLDGTEAAETDMGKVLRRTFHALDRMVADANRHEEISILRNTKPQPGERRDATSIPDPVKPEGDPVQPNPGEQTSLTASSSDDFGAPHNAATGSDNEKSSDTTATSTKSEIATGSPSTSSEEVREMAEEESTDDDSLEVTGKEEAAMQDRDMTDENDGSGEGGDGDQPDEVNFSQTTKVTAMFQRILSLGAQGGQVLLKVGADDDDKVATRESPMALTVPSINPAVAPSTSQPTIAQNGRMVCNLPDHAIHAGATAIVAVMTGKVLTVGNAGDSRAVLCRANGATFPLSFDHKPQDEIERNRITKAGGFVNQFGRVNGNLNLSRSLGDLKYKQVPGVPPSEQIITAEPDIVQVLVESDDEFIIIGCDGIWDCLTNENAVEYVRERIDLKAPADIGKDMLDDIISVDPRVTQGIGGDNMTIMIIDLQPSTRKWRTEPQFTPVVAQTETECIETTTPKEETAAEAQVKTE